MLLITPPLPDNKKAGERPLLDCHRPRAGALKLLGNCSTVSDARSVADAYIASLGGAGRRVADGEWGVTIDDAAGWPLHVGIRLRDGFLQAQAEVVGNGQVSDHELLFRNRGLRLVRLAHTGAGDVWVVGDLPQDAVSPAELDRLLGLLVAAAIEVRQRAGGRDPDSGDSRRAAAADEPPA
jgi:hypothetical protein